MFLGVLLLVAILQKCSAILYHVNDTEYARMPPLFGLDEYAGCLLPPDGTYCVARFDLHADNSNELMTIIREYSDDSIKHYNHTYIERGICLTKTCKKFIKNEENVTDLGRILEACLNASVWSEYGLQTKLSSVYYCDRHGEEKSIEVRDWIVAGVFIALLLLNVIGSCYDVYVCKTAPEGKGSQILLSFSVFRNWQWLTSETKDPKLKRLKGFHGVRVLTIMLMPLPHVMFINSSAFTDDPHTFEMFADTWYYQMLNNGLMIIQIFFVMSGFLLVYNLQLRAERREITWGMALQMYVLRWFRLTPAYAALIAFTATWYRHMGSGPVWKFFITNTLSRDCTNLWWQNLLYIHNYMPGVNECVVQSWYISVDTQLFCVGLVVYLMTKIRGRQIALSVLLALGVVLPAAHVWARDLDALVLIRPEFFRTFVNDTFYFLHAYGHNNLASSAVGMATAYLVYHLQKEKVDMSKNKVCIHLTWCVVPAMVCLFLSGNAFYAVGGAGGAGGARGARAAYAGLHRAGAGGVAAFALFVLCMRIDHPLRRAMESTVWVVPSRLSYSFYLLHFNIIFAYIALKTKLTVVSSFNMLLVHFGVLGMSSLLAVPFFLMIEAPFNRMLKVVFTQSNDRQNAKEMT